jgi:hypothetical protein
MFVGTCTTYVQEALDGMYRSAASGKLELV